VPEPVLDAVTKDKSDAKPQVNVYPADIELMPWGLMASISGHIAVVLFVAILAWLYHVRSLRELMTAAAFEPPPPPPTEEIEVVLQLDDRPPPVPDHIYFLRQDIQVTPTPTPTPTPTRTPTPTPKPQPIVHHEPVPKPVKPHPPTQAAPARNPAPTRIVVGSGHFPAPLYPAAALRMKIQGTVEVRVVFDGSGGVAEAEVISSSGAPMLDNAARNWILSHWHDASFAGSSQTVPIEFQIGQ
jgi:protein TonB